jgi:hypothetical protein
VARQAVSGLRREDFFFLFAGSGDVRASTLSCVSKSWFSPDLLSNSNDRFPSVDKTVCVGGVQALPVVVKPQVNTTKRKEKV